MEDESKWDLDVKRIRERHEQYEDKEGNMLSKTVHTAILANEDGVSLAINRDTPLPWAVGDPVTVRIMATQSKLEDHA